MNTTTSTASGTSMGQEQDAGFLFAEDIARLARLKSPRTVRGYLARSKAKHDDGEPLAPGDLPLPVAYVRRPVAARHHARSTLSPAWNPADITDPETGWLACRRPRGGNRRAVGQ